MADVAQIIRRNYAGVMERITAATLRSGRSSESVRLVAVTKYAESAWVRELLELGHRELGESRPQQLAERAAEFPPDIRWHLIGHLQRNKVRPVLPITELIHSVDSLKLLERIDRIADELGLRSQVLLQVNISGEETKDGFAPEELLHAWPEIQEYQQVHVRGLMTMAPESEDPEQARPVFRSLRELREELRHRSPSELPLPELSMGMSGDFEIAIEEGATLVRIGSTLFEGLE